MRIVIPLLLWATTALAQIPWFLHTGRGDAVTYPFGNNPSAAYLLPMFDAAVQHFNVVCSVDGVNWNVPAIQQNYATSGRDFSIIKRSGPIWWVAYTGVGNDANAFYITSTTTPPCQTNLKPTWTAEVAVSTAGTVVGQQHTWAPEWFVDPADASLHVLLSITDDATGNLHHQIYELHPTSGNDPAGAWSVPTKLTVAGKASIIDPFAVVVGSIYYLFYKEQANGGSGCVGYASAPSLAGAYTVQKTADWASWAASSEWGTKTCDGGAMEGPSLVQLSDRWRIYMDFYAGGGSLTAGQIIYSDSMDSWATWTAPIRIATVPTQAKHGTVIAYP